MNYYLTDPSGVENWNLRVNNINSNTNTDLVVEGTGTGNVVLKTNNINRLIVDDSGITSFSTLPECSVAPTTSDQLVNKTYTDGLVNQSTAISITNTNNNSVYYPTFVEGSGASQILRADVSNNTLTYNPFTSTLSSTNFNGNATTANTATSASTATAITIASTGSTDTKTYPVFVGANSATSQAPNTKSTLSFNANTGTLSATRFSGSGSGLSASSIPPTSIDCIRFYASRTSPQNIAASGNTPILFNNIFENTGSSYTNSTSTGVINVNTDGTYSITVTGTWSAVNVAVAFGVTLFGGIRIVLSTGFTYMGVTQYNGTDYISTVTAVLKLTTQTFRVFGYNITGGSITFDPLIEIVRLTGT